MVLRIVRRHDLAADVMEEAYLQIWRAPASSIPAIRRRTRLDGGDCPSTGDRCWRGGRPSREGEPEVIDENEGPARVPRHQLTDDLKRLLTCIGRLEPDRQRMLLLAYYGAFSREQLSIKLDMPVNLLRASLRRSLIEVEQCLKS